MAQFVVTLHSQLDGAAALAVFDTGHGFRHIQIEDLSTALGQPELRGVCCAKGKLYVTTPSSLRIYQINSEPTDGQKWFALEHEVVLPEWLLGKRPDAGLMAVHYSARKNRLLVACNTLASIDEFDLEGCFIARRHLWQIAPEHFSVPVQALGKGGFGKIRGIFESATGEVFLTVAFRNWADSGSVISYDSGELLLDQLDTPYAGLFLNERLFLLEVQRGRLAGHAISGSGKPLRIKAECQAYAALELPVRLRGLAAHGQELFAGLLSFERDEGKRLPAQLASFNLQSGRQQRLFPIPDQPGLRLPVPFYLTPLECKANQSGSLCSSVSLAASPPNKVAKAKKLAKTMPNAEEPSGLLNNQAISGAVLEAGRPVIQVHDASLSYRRGAYLHEWLRKKSDRSFLALSGLSMTLHEGEVLGLVGRNGSGKSTAAMLLAGILQPDQGRVDRQGRVQLLSLGVGFNNELSGRDNVLVNAALLGLSRRETLQHMDEIFAFSELSDFMDEPIRTYSAGMRSRLAFATATVVQPDVLILDEVLSTGDDSFRRKAETRMREMRGKAKSVVIVSHSAGQIRKLCNRVVWLEKGHLLMDGLPRQVMADYETFCQNPQKWLQRHPDIAARLKA